MSIDGLIQSIRTVERPEAVRSNAPLVALAPSIDVFMLGLVAGPVAHTGSIGLIFVLLTIATLAASGSYRTRISPRVTDEIVPLAGRLSFALVAIAVAASGRAEVHTLLRTAPLSFGLLLGGRALAYALIRSTRARGLALPEPTLIVGAGQLGEQAARVMREHPEYGLLPVGFLDGVDDNDLTLPLLGPIERLEAVVREFGVRRVVVAFGTSREAELIPVIRACSVVDVDVHVLPRFFELGLVPGLADIDDVWGLPLVRVRKPAHHNAGWRVKRTVDIVVASIGLVLAAPVMAACAIAVKLSCPGPILFRQKRVGLQGKLVEVLKFRSVRDNDESDTRWSVDGADCVTPVGRFLRKSGFDELPQLFNILRGDMSLVGPRPERPHFSDQFAVAVPGYEDRLRVPPGLTGWAQVHGLRGDTSIEDRARFDNHYIEHWSLWRDIVILFRTCSAVVRRMFS